MYKKYKLNHSLILSVTGILILGCESGQFSSIDMSSRPPKMRAQQVLLRAFSDSDAVVRSAAIEVVSTTDNLSLMPNVWRLFADPVVPVRFQALLAAGDLRYSPALGDIQRIFNNQQEDTNVRMAAAYALYRMGGSRYADYYFSQINSENPTVRANAALLIGKGGHPNGLKLLEWALNDKQSDDKVRIQAMESMAMLGDTHIYEKIWTRLISVYADDRITGVKAMGSLGTQQAMAALFTMLDDDVPEVRLVAAEQLGKLGDRRGEPYVRDILSKSIEGEPADQVRIKILAAMAIGEIGSDKLAGFLPRLLNDPSTMVQLAAAKAVYRSSQDRSSPGDQPTYSQLF